MNMEHYEQHSTQALQITSSLSLVHYYDFLWKLVKYSKHQFGMQEILTGERESERPHLSIAYTHQLKAFFCL